MKRAYPVDVLWCPNRGGGARRHNGWRFPPPVRQQLQRDFAGKTILHLFGGQADFGVRLDIDPLTRPDVIGDACHVRALQYFTISAEKRPPQLYVTRGQAMKYNRWKMQPQGFAFPPHV